VKRIFLLSLLILVVGCGSSGSTDTTEPPVTGTENNLGPVFTNVRDTELLGTFIGELSNGCTVSHEFTADGQYFITGLDRIVSASIQVEDFERNFEFESEYSYAVYVSDVTDNLQADCSGSNEPWNTRNADQPNIWRLLVITGPNANDPSRLVDGSTSEILGIRQ